MFVTTEMAQNINDVIPTTLLIIPEILPVPLRISAYMATFSLQSIPSATSPMIVSHDDVEPTLTSPTRSRRRYSLPTTNQPVEPTHSTSDTSQLSVTAATSTPILSRSTCGQPRRMVFVPAGHFTSTQNTTNVAALISQLGRPNSSPTRTPSIVPDSAATMTSSVPRDPRPYSENPYSDDEDCSYVPINNNAPVRIPERTDSSAQPIIK